MSIKIKLLDDSEIDVDIDPICTNHIQHHRGFPGLFWPINPLDKIVFVRPDVAHMSHPEVDALWQTHLQMRRTDPIHFHGAFWYGRSYCEKKISTKAYQARYESFAKFILLNWPTEAKITTNIYINNKVYQNTIEQISVGIFTED